MLANASIAMHTEYYALRIATPSELMPGLAPLPFLRATHTFHLSPLSFSMNKKSTIASSSTMEGVLPHTQASRLPSAIWVSSVHGGAQVILDVP